MPRLSFSLRDVFWLMLVVGIGICWWRDNRRLAKILPRMEYAIQLLEAEGYNINAEGTGFVWFRRPSAGALKPAPASALKE